MLLAKFSLPQVHQNMLVLLIQIVEDRALNPPFEPKLSLEAYKYKLWIIDLDFQPPIIIFPRTRDQSIKFKSQGKGSEVSLLMLVGRYYLNIGHL